MANTKTRNRKTRSYRGGSSRASGSGALVDTVRSTITQFTGNRNRGRGRGRGGAGGGLASQASGFVSGLLSGGSGGNRNRGGRKR